MTHPSLSSSGLLLLMLAKRTCVHQFIQYVAAAQEPRILNGLSKAVLLLHFRFCPRFAVKTRGIHTVTISQREFLCGGILSITTVKRQQNVYNIS